MRRTSAFLSCFSALVAAYSLQFSSLPSAWAEDDLRFVAPAVETGRPETVLQRGQRMELESRWGEALTLYEDALRQHPEDRELGGRHDLAKLHYDLARRYADASFIKSLTSLSERDSQALYNEVLLKIQSHYVNEPDWAALIERGISDLEIALADPTFARQNLRQEPGQNTTAVVSEMRKLAARSTPRNRTETAALVGDLAQLAQRQLGLSTTAVYLECTCAATNALDEYSSYLTSDQLNDVYSQIEGNFVGLGIELKANGTGLLIVKVITSSPADRGGLKAGDRITTVNGRSTVNMSTDQAANLLQGEEGSKVEIVVTSPDSSARPVSLRRAHVEVPSVDDVKIADREYGVGYVKVSCFQKTTSRDLDAALWKLHRDGMKTLVIDLRGNPGGLLTSAVEIADKFIESGTIVSTHGRSSIEDYTYSAHKPGTWRTPLIVLIDGDSASASEIFAGAISDHRRGTIIGEQSYGKGSVQGIFPLSSAGAGLRLTTAKFYSPSGAAISHVGVKPDVVVHKTAKPVEGANGSAVELANSTESDAVLDVALQTARRQVAQAAKK